MVSKGQIQVKDQCHKNTRFPQLKDSRAGNEGLRNREPDFATACVDDSLLKGCLSRMPL